jgi:hypothetical protein
VASHFRLIQAAKIARLGLFINCLAITIHLGLRLRKPLAPPPPTAQYTGHTHEQLAFERCPASGRGGVV